VSTGQGSTAVAVGPSPFAGRARRWSPRGGVRAAVLSGAALSVAVLLAGCSGSSAAPGRATVTPPPFLTEGRTSPPAGTDHDWVLLGAPALDLRDGVLTAHARLRNDSDETTATVQLTYGAGGPAPVVLTATARKVTTGTTAAVDLVATRPVAALPSGMPVFRVTRSF